MGRLVELLDKNRLTLIVSLPENSPDLARAAIEGGADALKVHINIAHAAAGTQFGSFSEEKDALENILKASLIPVGIVPGEKVLATEGEMLELGKMGFDFFDIKIKNIPEYMLSMNMMSKIVAVQRDYPIDKLMTVKGLGVHAVEADMVKTSDYGKDLNVSDLQGYISTAISAGVPVIVPTQKSIKVSEVPIIEDTGAKALMIGAIVTGKTANSIRKATLAYRAAIDDLG
jgi:hypothetical protein